MNWALADSQVECTEGVSTSDFTVDEEIVLSEVGGALPNSGRPGSHTVYSDLSCLIDTDGVEIESFEGDTRELDEPLHDSWLPFPQTILHGGELAELTLPIGVDTEGFEITVLIEIRGLASIRGNGDF